MSDSTHIRRVQRTAIIDAMGFDNTAANPAFILLVALAGLATGVLLRPFVIWLPRHIEREWHEQCGQTTELFLTVSPKPVSVLRWPLMLATGLAFAACAWRYGTGWQALAAMGCMTALIALAWIDVHTTLLPDVLTLALMWVGLLLNLNDVFAPLAHAVLGATGGYALLWLIFHAYRLATGREGMGHGDFKLVAAAGAWVGFERLPFLIIAASLLGVSGALALRALGRAQPGQPLPFGPYIALAFGATLLWR